MALNKPNPIGRRSQLLCIPAADLNVRSDKGGSRRRRWTEGELIVQSSRTRPAALEATFMNLGEIKRQTAVHHSQEQRSTK